MTICLILLGALKSQDLKLVHMAGSIHLNLDDGWTHVDALPEFDGRIWGPKLRYFAPPAIIERFYYEVVQPLPPYVLYGSGDFHHLAALFIRRFEERLTVISFDNHPDWDVRAPYWGCGAWVSRALEIETVERVSVWGCGNFELTWPSRWFANRKGLRSGKLQVNAWAERQSAATASRFNCMMRENWRKRFLRFAESVKGQSIYVTVDMDCLRAEEAVTNWENGLFTAADVAWAIGQLRNAARLVGGDLCGPWSEPVYEKRFQRFAGWWDHPKAHAIQLPGADAINRKSLEEIWPSLTGSPLSIAVPEQTTS